MPLFFLCADDLDSQSLGRLDPCVLNTQAMLEMFIDGVKDKSKFQDEHGNYLEISEWPTLEFDDDGNPTAFSYLGTPHEDALPLGGSVRFRFLPASITKIMLSQNELEGTLDTNDLPRNLISFSIPYSRGRQTFFWPYPRVPTTPQKIQVFRSASPQTSWIFWGAEIFAAPTLRAGAAGLPSEFKSNFRKIRACRHAPSGRAGSLFS